VVSGLASAWLTPSQFYPAEAGERFARSDALSQKLVQERADEIRRLQKVLETANIKLASVATDVLGKSGRSMLDAILGGQDDPEVLAELARGRMRAKLSDLRKALDGRVQLHHRVLLTRILAHVDFLEESLAQLQEEMEPYLDPFEEAVVLVQSVVGIGEIAASCIIAEIGTDMERFASDKHIASWAGLCPGNKQSGGKRLSGKTTKGNPYLRAILFEVAWAITHTKDNYLSAFYHRVVRRRGKAKAIVALAHKVLVIIYHILRTKQPYTDLGTDYFDQQDRERIERHHVHRLEQLGYTVTLAPQEVA
jgi:transposase